MRYLHDQHQIPLHKISVISYGPDKPVAPNKTRADRAQNRRIVINVLLLTLPRLNAFVNGPCRWRRTRRGTGLFFSPPGQPGRPSVV